MTKEQIHIIFEDEHMLVLNKPSGVVVNVSNTSSEGTLQQFLQKKLEKELSAADTESEFYNRAGLVHRLDKETSGVILAAKSEKDFENLKQQFMGREVEKEYVALALGVFEEDIFEINAPISRNPNKRTAMAVVSDGKSASTRFERVGEKYIDNMKMTLVKAFPKTGRTHQIRVHLAAMEHPVVGDDLYAGRKRSAITRSRFGRLMLHAHKITFKHPLTDKEVTFEAPLPPELSY